VTGVTRQTFVAAGTGITPAYAVLRAIFDDPADSATTAVLIYANRHEEDVLLAAELDALAARSGGRLSIIYTLSRPGPDWPHARGRIDEAMLRKHALAPGADAMAFMCGPPALVEGVVKPGLLATGYPTERVVVF
jgi:nitrate reductase (NAD(P)H)